jgi:diadenosine tetraphosphate (Ap4A) HIT family hydrolase
MENCVFCIWQEHNLLGETGLAYAIRDKYPVRPLHSLILPKRHVQDAFELTPEEFVEILQLARVIKDQILQGDPTIGGFNFGSNNGVVAGQKIQHAHFHLIPRRPGDSAPPPAT